MSRNFPTDDLPEGIVPISGTYYQVPFDSISVSEPDDLLDEDEGYVFHNPRLLTKKGEADLMDKKLNADLRESIKNHTLLTPLVCRWAQDEEGYYPLLVGGERRYRAIHYLRNKKEMVSDPNNVRMNEKGEWEYARSSADKVYNTVVCQVFAVNNDLDALALSWAENKNRLNLSEGHEIAEVIKLRKFDASDEKILEILQRDEKWLRETDNLIESLDTNTLNDLLEGRIDRGSARELAEITDIEVREKIRVEANEESEKIALRRKNRLQKRVEEALEEQDIARGAVSFAKRDGEEGVVKAQADVVEAEQKVKRVVKDRDEVKPVTTRAEVKRAVAKIGDEEITEERMPRVLSAKKIKKGLELVNACIETNGLDPEGSFELPIESLQLVYAIISENILANNPDFGETMKRFSEQG